jgi:hypothetical protein
MFIVPARKAYLKRSMERKRFGSSPGAIRHSFFVVDLVVAVGEAHQKVIGDVLIEYHGPYK